MRDRECKCKRDIRLQKNGIIQKSQHISLDLQINFEDYLQTGGTHLYNDKFQEKDHMVKITVADSGYFTICNTNQMEIDRRR